MEFFTRPDSPVYWLWLEGVGRKERTTIRIGTTTAQRRDSKRLALDRYHQRINELAAESYGLPKRQQPVTFEKLAETYKADVLPLRRGAKRELEISRHLLAAFGATLASDIDQDAIAGYQRARSEHAGPATVNRELSLLRAILTRAVGKHIDAVPTIRQLPVITRHRAILTDEEEARLIKAATDTQDKALILLAIDSLLRLGDLLDLKPEDRRGAWLSIREHKTGRAYEFALSPRAAAALDVIEPAHQDAFYFARYRRWDDVGA